MHFVYTGMICVAGFAEIERIAGTHEGSGGSDDEEAGAFYDAAKKRLSKSKKARAEASSAKEAAAAAAASSAYVEEDVEGERRASKDIMKNRGLTKYRNKERKYVIVSCSGAVILRNFPKQSMHARKRLALPQAWNTSDV